VRHHGRNADAVGTERRRIVEIVVDAVEGRAMVLAARGGYDTREVIPRVGEMKRAARTASCP
jgi:dihydrodipicolinate synthase/N-acetylneuraminate lyase